MPRTATTPTGPCDRRSTSLQLLLLLACLCSLLGTFGVASAAPSSSSLFVSSSGLLVDSPLSLQGVNIGSVLTSLRADLTAALSAQAEVNSQMAKQIAAQEALIATLQADLTATTDRLTAVESLSGSSAIVAAVQSVTIATDEIGSLTGSSDIVAAVLALRAAVSTVNASVIVLESTTSTASSQLAAALNSSTTSLQSQLATLAADFSGEIAELQARATIDESAIDANAAAIAALQTRATGDETSITSLQSLTASQSAQIASLANLTSTLDSQVALVADSGTFQATSSDIPSGTDVCYLTTRNAWVEGTIVKPLNITRNGTYAVFGTGRVTRLTAVTDWYWVLGLTLTRDGTMSLLTTAIGNPSTVSYVAGTVAYGDASRELHWVGALQEGDAVKLQYFVMSNLTSTVVYKIESNRNGGNRLTTLFLRA